MISKGTLKYVKSLQLKKYRKKAQSFLVEGAKSVLELINSPYKVTHLLVTSTFLDEHPDISQQFPGSWWLVQDKQLAQVGTLKTNNMALAVAEMLPQQPIELKKDAYYLALESVRDPGNLGTIIRTADWYGIDGIICSLDCVDFHHPKVIQASMGSFVRINPYYTDLTAVMNTGNPVYGAGLSGNNLHEIHFKGGGIFILGNESQGLSEQLTPYITHQITIPGFGGAESLNVSAAAAVICDNIRRTSASGG